MSLTDLVDEQVLKSNKAYSEELESRLGRLNLSNVYNSNLSNSNSDNSNQDNLNPNTKNQEQETDSDNFYKRGMEITSIYSIASFVDCYFTKIGMESGLYQEVNPLVNTLIENLGIDLGLFTTKLIGLSFVLGCYYCLDKAKRNKDTFLNIEINPVYVPYTLSLLNSLGGTFSMIKNYFI